MPTRNTKGQSQRVRSKGEKTNARSANPLADFGLGLEEIQGLPQARLPHSAHERQINSLLAGTILVEPRNDHDLIIPWVICQDQDSIVTVLYNWTTREIVVPKNTCVGTAYELSGDGLNREAEDVHKRIPAIRSCQVPPDLPSHLEPLWSDSKTELDNCHNLG
ncbi:hypothetical protein PoB_004243000 [Plakobranchus ocellatus]|uniref:Uncharacterized protein n=1 Tax=Plakobranchus ocellatus TaxID=259542 RepID=A0AAV4B5T1_9GAST|nr:hypothetical protein PoB_004243000 [Plakobranchus ocellatus]